SGLAPVVIRDDYGPGRGVALAPAGPTLRARDGEGSSSSWRRVCRAGSVSGVVDPGIHRRRRVKRANSRPWPANTLTGLCSSPSFPSSQSRPRMSARTPLPLALFALVLLTPLRAQDAVVRQDKVIAGGPKDALEVRHLVLQGTNEEIGKALATIAKERFGIAVDSSSDPLRTRAQRRYIEKNYPILFDRMR